MASSETTHKARFARNLRVLRKGVGLTQKELAERIGRSRATVNSWEDPNETALPDSTEIMERLARELGTTVRTLNYDDVLGAAVDRLSAEADTKEPRYRGRDLPRMVEVIAKRFELEALDELGASTEEMGVIRATLYSPETVLMFAGGYEGDAPMTDDDKVIEMQALTEQLRAWLKERIRRRTARSSKRKR